MTDRRNGFALSLVLAALMHAGVIGLAGVPYRGDGAERPRVLLLRFDAIAPSHTAPSKADVPARAAPLVQREESAQRSAAERAPATTKHPVEARRPLLVARTVTAIGTPGNATAETVVSSDALRDAKASESAERDTEARQVTYEQALAAWLDRQKYYPAVVRRRGLEGSGELIVRIDRRGNVLYLGVSRSLPYAILDEIARDWVNRADPFPAMPAEIKGNNFAFRVPVSFRLE